MAYRNKSGESNVAKMAKMAKVNVEVFDFIGESELAKVGESDFTFAMKKRVKSLICKAKRKWRK